MKFGRSRTLQSAKYTQKKKRKLIFTVILTFITSVLIVILFVLINKIPFIQIKNIEIVGATSIDSLKIKSLIENSLIGNYFYFIPKSNILFYPKDEIYDKLMRDFKKIDTLGIEIRRISKLFVNIVERIPEVMICEGFTEDDHTGCFLADKNGFIFEEVVSTTTNYFRYYSNSTDKIKRFGELQVFLKEVNKSNIETSGILVSDDGSYELYIKNRDKSSAIVYFDDRTSFDKTLSNLLVFWQNAIDKKIGLNNIPNFNYINLRFGNNIFYSAK